MSERDDILTHEQIRAMFLNEGKTKFVFLKFVLTEKQFLQEKPGTLVSLICTLLNLKTSDFNTGSFRMWLKRYRKSLKVASPSAATLAAKRNQTNLNADPSADRSAEKKKTPSNDPVVDDFKFTDPSTIKKEEKPLWHFVEPSK